MTISSSFAPPQARFFDRVNTNLQFTPEEMAKLVRNGFVVSDRLVFENFAAAYAYLHGNDLPVLITTDSLLHAIHQTYDDLLIATEVTLLYSRLTRLLERCRAQLQADASANADPHLAPLFADLDIYLAVPLALLSKDTQVVENTATFEYREMAKRASAIAPVSLFGTNRPVDFTLFKPRGHYNKFIKEYLHHEGRVVQRPHPLQYYFRAMMWLSQVDFRLVSYDEQGAPHLNPGHLAAAALLAQAIKRSSSYATWSELDTFLQALVGESDNITLVGLEHFLHDVALETPGEILPSPNADQLVRLLITLDYGQQRIAGQIQSVNPGGEAPVLRHVSFLLLGQRFAIDSYVMSNLVFDRLVVDGKKVMRQLPSPLDVMYALGNDRAEIHLQEELAKYGYLDKLRALRQEVGWQLPTFWTGSIYHRLLDVLRTLNTETTSETYPEVMRSAAWADKVLHTQLASWAQIRHDNILYVKQSFTRWITCEYPAGYVEPYPACYAAMSDYARMGQRLFANLKPEDLTESEQDLRQVSINSFQHLERVTNRLAELSKKELAQEPFTPSEEQWLKQTAVRHLEHVCGGTEEKWTGWYPQLFLRERWKESPALIADVHTNPPSQIDPLASVLHVATGQVATMPFIVNTDEGSTMYVGPTFTYYEVVTREEEPSRVTDQEWKEQLTTGPVAPPWTRNFRFSEAATPIQLSLGMSEE